MTNTVTFQSTDLYSSLNLNVYYFYDIINLFEIILDKFLGSSLFLSGCSDYALCLVFILYARFDKGSGLLEC